MKPLLTLVRRLVLIASLGCIAHWSQPAFAQTNETIRIVELAGTVEILPHGASTWVLTQVNQQLYALDRIRVGARSSVGLLWSDQSVLRFGALTELEILPPQTNDTEHGLHLIRGLLSFFHRDKPGRIRVITSGALAGIEGTEFVMSVVSTNGVEQTTLSVIDGKVRFSNERSALVLTNGQQAAAEPGSAPHRTPGFIANNLLQWCFYYPAVLDLKNLSLTSGEEKILSGSLAAYRGGDLLRALEQYPDTRALDSSDARIYHAALLLSAGQVEQSQVIFSKLTGVSERQRRLIAALNTLIAAVKREPGPFPINPELSTELLAASYYAQSRPAPKSLDLALEFARRTATNSPDFSFGWERVAELEFSFGRTSRALEALNKSLTLAPRNAQALALKGFLLAAQNKTREAIDCFDGALAVDSALGNAWLGRGLCRLRRGDTKAGREDLLIAAAMEPQRAVLRSYLGKAFGDVGETSRAMHELNLAKQLDPHDPTAWLYSALLNEKNYYINDAVRDLEKSQELNDNRSVYRSGLLLDQDRAVRSANLARIYQEAGMDDVAVREASRAVASDYANYSAHLFLANSYDALRDPNLINLRYETPAEVEYLLANLLAPVGAGILSPTLSQQEYSKLFERDRFGVISDTEYLSRGAWTQSGAQYGTFGDSSYSLEAFYRSDDGQRANNDVEQRQISLQVKQQITPKDSLYVQVISYEATGGDLSQYYDQSSANRGFHFNENQEPDVIIGYHREWNPGTHTLFLAARLEDTLSLTNPALPVLIEFAPNNSVVAVNNGNVDMQQKYTGNLEIYTTELQQLWQRGDHDTIIGGRAQWGNFQTHNLESEPSFLAVVFTDPAADQNFSTDFLRTSVYGYHYWRVVDSLELIGGVSFDLITYPENFRAAPISGNTGTAEQVSPKAGFIWTPTKDSTVRFAYTRSLSGASLDQSFQLEPAQIAGFVQSYRSLIPESISGPQAGAQFETFGISLEQKFRTQTYIGVTGEILDSSVRPQTGAFYRQANNAAVPSQVRENLDYHEYSVFATVNQLLGRDWSVGARYGWSESQLSDGFSSLRGVPFSPPLDTEQTSILQQADLFAVFNDPCGAFARFDALWYGQSNQSVTMDLPGDDFYQFNFLVGYRSPHRRVEVSVGILNLTGRDYHLYPLTPNDDLPRTRTMFARLGLNF